MSGEDPKFEIQVLKKDRYPPFYPMCDKNAFIYNDYVIITFYFFKISK